jgi:hypothetical protein
MEDKILKKFQGRLNKGQTSLLESHKSEIQTYIKREKSSIFVYMEDDSYLDQLDAEFQKYMEKEPEKFDEFLKNMIKEKFRMIQQRTQFQSFLKELGTNQKNSPYKFPTLIKEEARTSRFASNIFHNEDFNMNIYSNQLRMMNKILKAEFFEDKKRQ